MHIFNTSKACFNAKQFLNWHIAFILSVVSLTALSVPYISPLFSLNKICSFNNIVYNKPRRLNKCIYVCWSFLRIFFYNCGFNLSM